MRLVAMILVTSCAVGACFSSSRSDPTSYEGITWPGTKVGSGGPSSGPSVGNGSSSESNSSTSGPGSGPKTGNGGARYSTTVGQGGAGGPALHNDLPNSIGSPSQSSGSSGGASSSGGQGPGPCELPANANAMAGCAAETAQEICEPDVDGGAPDCFSPCDDTEYQVECFSEEGGAAPSPDPSLGCSQSTLGGGQMIYCCPCG